MARRFSWPLQWRRAPAEPDFCRRQVAGAWLGPVVALVGALALSFTWLEHEAAREVRDSAELALQAHRSLHATRAPVRSAAAGALGGGLASSTPAAGSGERRAAALVPLDRRQAEGERIARLLETDWLQRLGQIESTGGTRLVLTGLRIETGRQRMQLRGESPDLNALADMRNRLLQQDGVREVDLVRHERVQADGRVRHAAVMDVQWQ